MTDEPFTPCAAPDCARSPAAHIGFLLGHQYQDPAEEQPTEAGATAPLACQKCGQPFVEDGWFVDSRARHGDSPFCGECVDQCRDSEIADHWCVVDQWRTSQR
ncbi:MAG: hypothetical protein HOV73_01765 [Streptomyces sp.]|nr:hypothetical protein [Streptomyces sp.]